MFCLSKKIGLILLFLATFCTSSCKKNREEAIEPEQTEMVQVETPPVFLPETPSMVDYGEITYDTILPRQKTGPTIVSVMSDRTVGVNTITSTTVNSVFRNYGVIPTEGNIVTIKGNNFGSQVGTVTISNVASYKIDGFVSWTNTEIKIRMSSSLISVPAPSSLNQNKVPIIAVKPRSSNAEGKFAIKLTPSNRTRVMPECVYFTTNFLLKIGQNVQPAGSSYPTLAQRNALPNNYFNINNDYIPAINDVWIWNQRHQAIVSSLSIVDLTPSATTRNVTYNCTISESNINTTDKLFSATYNASVTFIVVKNANGTETRTELTNIGTGFRSNLNVRPDYCFR